MASPRERALRVIDAAPGLDLLDLPPLGFLLKRRWVRGALRATAFTIALAMLLHGFLGPDLAPKNLATVLTWVHFRGGVVFALVLVGNLFCYACPFMFVRDAVRKVIQPGRSWPRPLRKKWLSAVLFALVLFLYEALDLWSDPTATAILIVAYFGGIVVVDALFAGASFCKWVCPVGQFNFVSALLSPFEVRAKRASVCESCTGKECIKGRTAPEPPQRGCELALYLPRKEGNLDCTFCLDCAYACPEDNVGLIARVPGEEISTTGWRAGLGHLTRRPDLAVLAVLFTFGALLNAFSMVSPVYRVQAALAEALSLRSEPVVLAIFFTLGLVVVPALATSGVALAARAWAGTTEPVARVLTRHAFGLVPIGLAVWFSHYAFHFLTGAFTFVPVVQLALRDLGIPILGPPDWTMSGMPASAVYPLEIGVLALGASGSVATSLRLAAAAGRPRQEAYPWIGLTAALLAAALWLLSQPMEMRATFLGGG